MSHLPSLQQPSPQHDLPSAIFPSFIIGHLSLEQHEHPLALSPAAGAAGVAVCAIIASANSSVNSTINTLVFMISSNLLVARTRPSAGPDLRRLPSPSRRRSDPRPRF